ncbi:MAG: 3-dehydroquinate synthase [Syntrophomonadaceae bacterium]|nr:3-dehydroquinate synthase [Syntrophomonadaceae bacterium]
MQSLLLNLGQHSYEILIGQGLLKNTGSYLKQLTTTKKVIVVSNPTIFSLYGPTVTDSLSKSGFEVITHLVPDGEEYKNIEHTMKIIDTCIDNKVERNSVLIALGGGVIGDLAGFVSAIYQRGTPFVQIPTTLLAQVDSSVGGKVAVNHPQGKNMIGAFHQPKLVIADTNTLDTLDIRDYNSGLGEVVKYGIIYDYSFFTWLEDNTADIINKSSLALAKIIYESCRIKSNIVEQDEKETGLRAILNLGHTFGHAIETISGYGTYRHGEAVIMGTIAAGYLAMELSLLSEPEFNRIINLYKKLNIFRPFPDIPTEDVYKAMLTDKKVAAQKLTFILPKGLGNYAIVNDIEKEKVLKAINLAQNNKS